MRAVLLAFVAGCWLLQQQAALPGCWTWAAWMCIALAGLFATWMLRGRDAQWTLWGRRVAAMSVAAVVGLGWSAWRAELRLGEWLDPALAGTDQSIEGVIDGLPDSAPHGTRFLFYVERAQPGIAAEGGRQGESMSVPARLLLMWREPPETLQPGQRYQLTVRLRRPRGLANPHGFDYAYWLLAEGVGRRGTYATARRCPRTRRCHCQSASRSGEPGCVTTCAPRCRPMHDMGPCWSRW